MSIGLNVDEWVDNAFSLATYHYGETALYSCSYVDTKNANSANEAYQSHQFFSLNEAVEVLWQYTLPKLIGEAFEELIEENELFDDAGVDKDYDLKNTLKEISLYSKIYFISWYFNEYQNGHIKWFRVSFSHYIMESDMVLMAYRTKSNYFCKEAEQSGETYPIITTKSFKDIFNCINAAVMSAYTIGKGKEQLSFYIKYDGKTHDIGWLDIDSAHLLHSKTGPMLISQYAKALGIQYSGDRAI